MKNQNISSFRSSEPESGGLGFNRQTFPGQNSKSSSSKPWLGGCWSFYSERSGSSHRPAKTAANTLAGTVAECLLIEGR